MCETITASIFAGSSKFRRKVSLVLRIELRPQSISTRVVSLQTARQLPLLLLHKLLKYSAISGFQNKTLFFA